MSTVTITLMPRHPSFPLLLPVVPKPHPTPLPPGSDERPGHLNDRRNLRNEFDDLSDEEDEVEGQWKDSVQMRGYNSLHVIGRLRTRQEEKVDQAESDSEDEGSGHSGDHISNNNDGENGSDQELEQDLDATMEDLDEVEGRNEQFSPESIEQELEDEDEDGDGDEDEEPEL